MKTKLIIGSVLTLLAACGSSAEKTSKLLQEEEDQFNKAMNDSLMVDGPTYYITQHQIRGRTKDIQKSILVLENFTKSKKGYIQNSQLQSKAINSQEIRFSKDSLAKITEYQMQAELILKIPYFQSDSALLIALNQFDFVDSRTITNESVKANYLENLLSIENSEKLENESKSWENKTSKTASNYLVQTESTKINLQEAKQAKIANLKLEENIIYATLLVSIYEQPKIMRENVFIPSAIEPYEPNFFEKAGASIISGLEIFETIVLLILKNMVWVLALISTVFLYKKWKNRLSILN
ncbi:MAG: hypothetical protein K9H61_06925 [Bacteroidia bacterium]|nr:hypothetical protein [Bacteroidia bacterium]MCF8426743.1 hypothetical protein [Bacteroidia bacterium]MCF8446712.1 hypothetical protein [Bacteroidia bacterium]